MPGGEHLEIIHHPGYDKNVPMPFSPAIKVKSGKLVWLAGGTALPVYHEHPHRRARRHRRHQYDGHTVAGRDGNLYRDRNHRSPGYRHAGKHRGRLASIGSTGSDSSSLFTLAVRLHQAGQLIERVVTVVAERIDMRRLQQADFVVMPQRLDRYLAQA